MKNLAETISQLVAVGCTVQFTEKNGRVRITLNLNGRQRSVEVTYEASTNDVRMAAIIKDEVTALLQ